MNLEEDAAGHLAEQLVVRNLKDAVDRALSDPTLRSVEDKLAFVGGFISSSHPEITKQLMRIWKQPGVTLYQD